MTKPPQSPETGLSFSDDPIRERLFGHDHDRLRAAASKVEDIDQHSDPRERDLEYNDKKGEVGLRGARRRVLVWLFHTLGLCACALIVGLAGMVAWAAFVYFSDTLATAAGAKGVLWKLAEFLGAASFTLVIENQVKRVTRSEHQE